MRNFYHFAVFSMCWSSAKRMPTYLALDSLMCSQRAKTSAPNFLAQEMV